MNYEIDKTDKAIKDITKKTDNSELASQDRRELSVLLEEQEYFINQHKYHIESLNCKDQESLKNLEDKYKKTEQLEHQVKQLKENINECKEKLNKNLENTNNSFGFGTNSNLKDDLLDNTRKVRDGN